jgi:hypothetical protein
MEIKVQLFALEGFFLELRTAKGQSTIEFSGPETGPLNAILNWTVPERIDGDSEFEMQRVISGRPHSEGGFSQQLLNYPTEKIENKRFDEIRIWWELSLEKGLQIPVWEVKTNWDKKQAYIPYFSLLKIISLCRAYSKGDRVTIEKLIQAQAGIPIEELLKSPNVKTGTWLDDEFPCCPEENPDVKEPYPYRNPPQPKGRDALELVEEVVDQTGRYVYSHNKIDQSIADGNRDFAIRVLKNNGLYPKPTDEQGLGKVDRLKLKDVPKLLEAMGKLTLYAASEERRRWNPEALATDSLAETLVSYDWFLYQRLPSEWDEFDALARLERIFNDEKPTSPGFIYTKIFDIRLRLIVRMELDERLILVAAEEMQI